MDGDDLELFRRAVHDALAAHADQRVDHVLEQLEWRDALDNDFAAAVAVLFDCQGSLSVSSTALDDVLGATLAPGRRPGAAVVYPALDRWQPPAEAHGDELSIEGLASARLTELGEAIVVAETAEGESAATVRAADLDIRSVSGMDPGLGLMEVSGTVRMPAAPYHLAPGSWSAAARSGQLALAHELLGAAGAMLELARLHGLERTQFGKPIGAFQAVSHKLADTLVAIEGARAAISAVWDDPAHEASAGAKALAGRAAKTAARHGQQVLAGIGFTTEHPFQRYVRRVLVLDELFGSSRTLTRHLGRLLIEDRRLPPLPPL